MKSKIELHERLDLLTRILRYSLVKENYNLLAWTHRVAINMERAAIMHAIDEIQLLNADYISVEYQVPKHIESRIEAIERTIIIKSESNEHA